MFYCCLVVLLSGCFVDRIDRQLNHKTTRQQKNPLMFFWEGGYCLPDSRLSCGYNPETSSRVTLASLGIGFQPNLAYSVDSGDSCYLSPLMRLFLDTNDSNSTNSVRSKNISAQEPAGSFAHVQNLSRIARMRQILSFTDFLYVFGFVTDFLAPVRRWIAPSEGKIRKNQSADRRMKSETMENKKSVKEQIRRIRAIRVPFERLWSSRSDEHMKSGLCWYCLPNL